MTDKTRRGCVALAEYFQLRISFVIPFKFWKENGEGGGGSGGGGRRCTGGGGGGRDVYVFTRDVHNEVVEKRC